MLKQLAILAALLAIGIGQAQAQKREGVLHRIAVPGADFDLVLAVPKPDAPPVADFGNMPDALVIHLKGGDLALVFDDAGQMLEALDILQRPVSTLYLSGEGSQQSVVLHVAPNRAPARRRLSGVGG